MTDNEMNDKLEPDEAPSSDRRSDPLGGLLKRALSDAPVPERSLLPGIQHRIRVRTKGRHYRDRWRSARDPVSLLLMVALFILILAATVFLVMEPLMDAASDFKGPTPKSHPQKASPVPHAPE